MPSSVKSAFLLSEEAVREAIPLGTLTGQGLLHRRKEEDGLTVHPIPSNEPTDPLNWPMWRKVASLLCMSLYAFIANFTSGSLSSALPFLASPEAFNPPISINRATQAVAVNVLMLGAANLWWVPLSNFFGRRPVILLGLLTLTFCSLWADRCETFGEFLAARLFMGIGGAPADTIAPRVIGEVFFVHESGRSMAVYTLFIATGPLIGGVSGGYIVANLGLSWLHWVNIILSGSLFVLCLFFQPETLFRSRQTEALVGHQDVKPVTEEVEHNESPQPNEPCQKLTWKQSMQLIPPHWAALRGFWTPLATLRFPGVILVMLWYAGLVGGMVTMGTVGPTIVSEPPYLWGKNAGLINVGGIIGAFLGAVTTAIFADQSIRPYKVRDGAYYIEPETRLPVTFPGLFLGTTGLWVFGFCAQYPSPHAWVGLQVGIGMLAFGIMQVPSIGFNYIIESYTPVAADCFTAVTMARAILSFAWTFFVGIWSSEAGPQVPFGVFGGLMGFFSLLVFPVWIWGKRFRIVTTDWIHVY